MKEKEAEFLRSQRRKRRRIGKMRQAIILIVAGWIILSMILIAFLFVRTEELEDQLKRLLLTESSAEAISPSWQEETTEEQPAPEALDAETDTENLAKEGDVHKVYLTFDSSPSRYTEEILDILAAHEVKATFFVIGREDEESQELYRRIAEDGHTLGMRSYSNRYSVIYRSKEAFAED